MCPPLHTRVLPGRHPAARGSIGLVLALPLLLALADPEPTRADPCAPWPGEVSPLPTTSDPDRMRAQWATLRRDELTRVASGLEGIDRLEAHRLWRHAGCLEPGDPVVEQALVRTRPTSLHHPHVRAASGDSGLPPVAASTFETALQQVTVRVIAAAPPVAEPTPLPHVAAAPKRPAQDGNLRPAATQPRPVKSNRQEPRAQCGTTRSACSEIDALNSEIARLDALVRGARFRETLERADAMTDRLRSLDQSPPSRELRVRAEVLRATAEVALGNASQARDAFARALLEDPELHLDPMAVSPKVRRALEEARRGGVGG